MRPFRLEDDKLVADVQSRLVAREIVEPVDGRDRTRWEDFDLFILVENRLGIAVGPDTEIDDATREEWIRRATDDGRYHPVRDDFRKPYWILDGGERVGTVALSNSALYGGAPSILNLFVFPERRRGGHARRVVTAASEESIAAGLDGIWLETSWCWPHAVRTYCNLGMWVRSWKRDLAFVWLRDLPRWHFEMDGTHARLFVGGSVAMTASRTANRLTMTPVSVPDRLEYLVPGLCARPGAARVAAHHERQELAGPARPRVLRRRRARGLGVQDQVVGSVGAPSRMDRSDAADPRSRISGVGRVGAAVAFAAMTSEMNSSSGRSAGAVRRLLLGGRPRNLFEPTIRTAVGRALPVRCSLS